ncbi:MAG: hypothetical protein H6Q89_2504 [Myxococcaceae bacterium]|nr:hypothetical protein [Myxococcaceae bacterium]
MLLLPLMSTQAVFGVLKTRVQAAAVIRDVSRTGFNTNQISVLVPETPAATGGQTGEELGLLTGLVEVSIPGLRTTHGAGPLVATLAGWSTAGVTHGLIALRLSESLAHQYEKKIGEGFILISVQTHEPKDVDRLKAILWQNLAENVGASEPPPEVSGINPRPSRPPAVIPL